MNSKTLKPLVKIDLVACLTSCLLSIALAIALMAPDLIAGELGIRGRTIYSIDVVFATILFCFLLLLSCSKPLILFVVIAFGLMAVLQLCYLAYFGGMIDPNAVEYGLNELRDVTEAAIGVTSQMYKLPFVVLVPFAFVIALILRFDNTRARLPLADLVVIFLLSLVPIKAYQHPDPVKYFPIDYYPSYINSYLTLSVLGARQFNKLTSKDRSHEKQYALVLSDQKLEKVDNIVLIMAESLSPDRMSILGHERRTTESLEVLCAEPISWCLQGISAGVGTKSSLHTFWNGARDPRNRTLIESQAVNLFRLARQKKFRTTLISSQGNNLLRGDGTRFIDYLVTRESDEDGFNRLHDERLIEWAKKIPLAGKNLIIFHTRSVHGPYAENYRNRPEYALYPTTGVDLETFQQNSYDNAVSYIDAVVAQIIETMRSRIDGALLIVVTSDHGQLLGEDGLFGHGRLIPEIANVPMLFFGRNLSVEIRKDIAAFDKPTHSELHSFISRLIGFKIEYPDAEDGIYFINGTARYGEHGVIKVIKDLENKAGGIRYEILPGG